jgi:hypothetical protein
MQFFRSIPKTLYSFDFKNQSPKVITNIFSRFKVKSSVLTNAFAFNKYQIEDGDTPEIVAYKHYGDPKLHWIICLTNDLIDPQFDFPLSAQSLENYILKKYNLNTIEESFSINPPHHHVLKIEKTLSEVNGITSTTTEECIVTLEQYNHISNSLVNKITNSPTTETIVFRQNNSDPNSPISSTLSIKSTYIPVSIFDYETEVNESKRQIKILKPEYAQAMSMELENILNG